jgi:hypothetical protein
MAGPPVHPAPGRVHHPTSDPAPTDTTTEYFIRTCVSHATVSAYSTSVINSDWVIITRLLFVVFILTIWKKIIIITSEHISLRRIIMFSIWPSRPTMRNYVILYILILYESSHPFTGWFWIMVLQAPSTLLSSKSQHTNLNFTLN